MNKQKYPSPYDMSDVTYIDTTKTKVEFIKVQSIENKIDEINKKLDQILEALKDFEKSK